MFSRKRRDRTSGIASDIASGAMFVCLAMIFSYIEAMISFTGGIAGFKFGFANIVVIVALYKFGRWQAFLVNGVRIFMLGMLFGTPLSMIFSIAGGLLSFLVMYFIWKSGRFSAYGVSMTGAVFHNIGQLTVACVIFETPGILLWMPVYTITGIIAGIITGYISIAVMKRI